MKTGWKIFKNLDIRIASLLLAVLLWLHAATEREYQQKIYCPVTVKNLPAGFVPAAPLPVVPCLVTARGKDMIAFSLKPPWIEVDLANRQVKRLTVELASSLLRWPFDLEPIQVSFLMAQVTINLDRLGQKRVKIIPDITGVPAGGYIVCDSSRALPDSVTLSGPQRQLERIDSLYAGPVKAEGKSQAETIRCRVAVPDSQIFSVVPDSVSVRLCFEKTQEKVFNSLPVVLVNRGSGYLVSFSPGTIDLVVAGPAQPLSLLKPSDIKVSLDLKDLPPGHHRLQAVIELPEKLELMAADPRDFEVDIK
jgi:YbbR domain-containing protein